jgi:hypothetical protein
VILPTVPQYKEIFRMIETIGLIVILPTDSRKPLRKPTSQPIGPLADFVLICSIWPKFAEIRTNEHKRTSECASKDPSRSLGTFPEIQLDMQHLAQILVKSERINRQEQANAHRKILLDHLAHFEKFNLI